MPSGFYDHYKIRGVPKSEEHNEKNRLAHLGKKNQKIAEGQRGAKNSQWVGSAVGYKALHQWVAKNFLGSMVCEHCWQEKENNRQIHWANKSGEYTRQRSDWMRLCVKCHKAYDKKN